MEKIRGWFTGVPFLDENIEAVIAVILAVIAYFITKKVLFQVIAKLVKKTKTDLDDIFLNDRVLRRISFIPPLIILYSVTFFELKTETIIDNILEAIIAFVFLLTITAFIDAIIEVIQKFPRFRDRPMKGYGQVVKIILYIIGIVFIIGLLTGQNPWGLFAGLGAMSAILLLIFKDTILSFVASIQITSYDLVKVGDWIEMPKYGVDGDIMDIALHTVKVRNFDKTITVIPTLSLIETSFKNWRGMQETGGRRIKRSIYLDLASIKFCTDEMLKRYENFVLISDYIKFKKEDISKYNSELKVDPEHWFNGRRLTNIGTFREYLKSYLKNRKDIRQDLTFLVRQLPATEHGLPIEIYIFAATTVWTEYEEIQADIFDHIFAIIPEFDLKIYQSPSSHDLKEISAGKPN
ncbi:MAG: mechanosensitive ion channel family protein [Melioribacteraceae bacterium]|nr:mechanosensitive ion channel family protein [Melioribacteraceae bacterium]